MFILKLYDRLHQELNLGDIVRISEGREFTFFARVTYLEGEKAIAPFHTFSFHSVEKVDNVPTGAIKSTEERYDIWWLETPESDYNAADFEKYLMDWRACETLLEKSCFTLEPKENTICQKNPSMAELVKEQAGLL